MQGARVMLAEARTPLHGHRHVRKLLAALARFDKLNEIRREQDSFAEMTQDSRREFISDTLKRNNIVQELLKCFRLW